MDRGSGGWVLVVEEAALPRYPFVPAGSPISPGLAVLQICYTGALAPQAAVLKMCSHLTFLFLVSDGAP